MKKSISAILVAALMLFAFTACEQQMPTITGDPVGMTATVSKTNYLVGQEVDLSTVSATVDFSGNVSKTFAGTELTFFGDKEITAGENTLSFAYGKVATSGSNPTGDYVGASVTVYGYTARSVTLNNMPTEAVKGTDGTITLDTSAVTATVVDEKGNTYEVAADDVDVGAAVAAKVGSQDVTISSVSVYGENVLASTETTGFKVTVSEGTTPEKTFTGYTLDVTSKAWITDTYAWTLYENYSDGSKVPAATDSTWSTVKGNYIIISADDGDGKAETSISDVPTAYTQYAQSVTILEKANPAKGEYKMTFPKGENSIKTKVDADDVVFYDIASDKVTANLTKANVKIEVENLLNTSKDGASQEYMADANYSISHQKVDETNWYAVVEVNYSIKGTPVREAFEVTLALSSAQELPEA